MVRALSALVAGPASNAFASLPRGSRGAISPTALRPLAAFA